MFSIYVKLMEECAEVIQASSKVIKRGRHGVEKQLLSEEVGDVQAIIGLMVDRGLVDESTIARKQYQTESKYKNEFNTENTWYDVYNGYSNISILYGNNFSSIYNLANSMKAILSYICILTLYLMIIFLPIFFISLLWGFTIMDEFLEQFLKTLTMITLFILFPLIFWGFFISLF